MSHLQRYVLRKYPQLYFVIAAVILVAKVLGIPPTGFIAWPLALLVVAITCVLGVMGMRTNAKQ
ncbi:MAG: hypothetical protein RL318_2301 [Fibrobacterota bacterium]|jgi:hypothetical protein